MRVLCVDIGGTNMEMGIIENEKIISRNSKGVKSAESYNGLLTLIKAFKQAHGNMDAIGIGIPGLVDTNGMVIASPNMPFMNNVNIKKEMEKSLGVKVYVGNDANLYALGEWQFGAGEKKDNVVVITLGTGIGGGIIINKKLVLGVNFFAGEIGHILINADGQLCNCGQRGCFEAYAGGDYFEKYAAKSLLKAGVGISKNFSMAELYKLAAAGEQCAIKLFQEYGRYIAKGLVSIIHLLDPEKIIIGGGISKSFKFFKDAMTEELASRVMGFESRNLSIEQALLQSDAGLFGAYFLSIKNGKV